MKEIEPGGNLCVCLSSFIKKKLSKWVHEASLLQQGQARGEPTDLPDKTQGGGKLGLPGERRFAPRVGRAGQMKSIEPGACVCARVRVWCA
jgi:hypothetical protein